MAATWTGTGAGGFDGGFATSTWTITGATLGVGDIYLFVFVEAGNGRTLTVTIDGVSATLVDTVQSNTGNDSLSIYKAACSNATGNIVISDAFVFATVSANWGLATGEGTPVATYAIGGNGTTQGPVTGTVLSNGVGALCIASMFGNAGNPSTWSGATRIAAMEGGVATGNASGCSGATVTSAGAVSATVTGGSGWNFTNNIMALLAFPAAGAAAFVPYNPWPQAAPILAT